MLTDLRIKKEKPREKSFKVSDGGGLYLFVSPSGGKLWRFKYLFGGKEKLLSLGPYPDISLLAARSARDDAKATLRSGRDPSINKKLQKLAGITGTANSFEAVARNGAN